ncbi:MAG TPA: VOC family protein [Polyangia bacterium]
MGIFKGINVVSVEVADLDKARTFYRDVLGLGEPAYDLPEVDWIEFRSGGPSGNVAVTRAQADNKPGTTTTLVFNVDDCHEACTELRSRGVRCEDPIVYPGYVTFCTFYDPFGNRLQMCSPAPEQVERAREEPK